jgi:flagellin-like hook-associated protein FlgL
MSIFGLRSNGLASSAYKNLSRAQASLTDNISRLASGLRINKTADDSAGSNVSVRMGNQVSGMAQANRNAQDTNNLLATAESGLSDISDILGKMRELSVQASTDTLNDNDRASINLEFQALKDELTRISNATEYNGMNVLNGTYQSDDGRGQWRIQIGADNDVNNQHQFSLMDSTATGLGLQDSTSSTSSVESSLEVTSSSNVTFTDSGQSLGSASSFGISLGDVDDDGDLDAFAANYQQANKVWINEGSGNFTDSGQSLGSSNAVRVELGDVDNDGDLDAFAANQGPGNKVYINEGNGTFTDSGQSLGSSLLSRGVSLGDVDNDGDLDAFVANESNQANKVWINDGSGNFTDSGQSLGSSKSLGVELGDVDNDGDLDAFVANKNQANKVWINEGHTDVGDITLNQAEAGDYTLTYDGTNTFSLSRDGGTAVDYVLTTDPATTGSSETATFNLDGNDITIELKQGYAQIDGSDFTFNVQNTTTNTNVLSVDDARTAITAIDHAIDEVNRERSYIGSEQNKLQFTMSNLSNNIQNIEASRSTIEDADFAAEAADLAKNQILAQSATAMLAQASAISQNVLGLLS